MFLNERRDRGRAVAVTFERHHYFGRMIWLIVGCIMARRVGIMFGLGQWLDCIIWNLWCIGRAKIEQKILMNGSLKWKTNWILPQIANDWNVFRGLIMIAILEHAIIGARMPC